MSLADTDKAAARAPKISVCVPAHNAALYLTETLDSVLAQDWPDYELIVCEDASTDQTLEICERYASHPCVKVISSSRPLGQAGNFKRCIDESRGEYVLILHADDLIEPTYLRRAVTMLDANPDVAFVHCTARRVDSTGTPLEMQQLFAEDTVDRSEITLRRLLVDGCVVNPAGVTVRRAVYAEVGEFVDIIWGIDWHMWTRIALTAPIGYLAEPLSRYRVHGNSATSAVWASGAAVRDERWAVEDVFALIDARRPDLASLRRHALRGVALRSLSFAELFCQIGDRKTARTGIADAVKLYPPLGRTIRVIGLSASTYVGYHWFRRVYNARERLAAALGL